MTHYDSQRNSQPATVYTQNVSFLSGKNNLCKITFNIYLTNNVFFQSYGE